MKRYWISWEHCQERGAFEINSPWWISGYGIDVNPIVCAAIKTDMKPDDYIRLSYDNPPNDIQFRFIEEKPADWSPFCDRFEKADWMKWDEEPVIKEFGDKTIEVGDTVRMQYPPKFNHGWISVKDRLPENDGDYVVYAPSWKHRIKILYFSPHTKNSRKRFWQSGIESTKVTHWMPLPEQPNV